jgi:uncharacterized membrane protein
MFAPLPSFSPDHIHPILVNFTAALLPSSVASDIAGCVFKKRSLHNAGWWMLIFATAVTPFTAVAGLLWKRSVGAALPADVLLMHQRLGIALAILFLVLAVWRRSAHSRDGSPSIAYLAFASVVVAVLIVQGSLGGQMAFGS